MARLCREARSLPKIAIAGNLYNGKTTLAKQLVDLTGGVKIAFADALKDEVASVAWLHPASDPAQSWAMVRRAIDEEKASYRPLLQYLGERFRNIDETIWITELALTAYADGIRQGRAVIIDDLRYRNEFAWVQEAGFLTVHVTRPADAIASTLAAHGVTEAAYRQALVHESENDLANVKFDLYVNLRPDFPPEDAARLILQTVKGASLDTFEAAHE